MDVNALQTQLHILTAAVGLLVVVVGAVGGVLKLSMNNALHKSEQRIITEVKNEFARKEMVDVQMRDYDRRLSILETRSTVNKVVNGAT